MKAPRAGHRQRLCFLGFLLFPALVAAELAVIHDSGDTRPLAPLLEVLAERKRIHPRAQSLRRHLGAAEVERLLPIRSPGLSVGKVVPRSISQRFARPFFLIGSDSVSRE
jgi:hypothetical protein